MAWQVADAKAKFSELLDTVESEGLQLVQRRKRTFLITTQEEMDRRLEEARRGSRQGFQSAWGRNAANVKDSLRRLGRGARAHSVAKRGPVDAPAGYEGRFANIQT